MDDGNDDSITPKDGSGEGDFNPFSGMPLFGDLSRALSGQGPLNWDAARQFALLAASGGDMAGMMTGGGAPIATANIDPSVRIKYAELGNIARLHVADVMQLPVADAEPEVATAEQWAVQTLDAYRPLFNDLAASLGQTDDVATDASTDPMAQMMAGLSKMIHGRRTCAPGVRRIRPPNPSCDACPRRRASNNRRFRSRVGNSAR
jgi:hypothetical protein